MSGGERGLTQTQAESIWRILAEECGASSYAKGFVHSQQTEYVAEWRFCGSLGFGGKFWRNRSRRPDGSWGENWYVNYYREDETPERDAAQNAANERLWKLLAETEQADA